MAEIKITSGNFEAEVLRSDLPVIVDFWAEWCGPCKMLAPTVAEIANEFDGKIKVGKVNVDEDPQLAIQFGVNSIPTVIGFKNGKVSGKSIGFVPKQNLLDLVK